MPFDFDLLKLANIFPHNILEALVKNNPAAQKAGDGATILRINSDVQSLRLIYAYYNTMDLIIPETQIEKELLLNTCDFFAFVEISKKIEELFLAEENNLDVIIQPTDEKINNENIVQVENHSEDQADYITLPNESRKNNNLIDFTINPKCNLSDLDKKILMDETILRKEYAQGNRPPIPRIKFINTKKDPIPIDHPYTLVNNPNKFTAKWVGSNEEFMENLKIYSFGILDETMPPNLVVAGSAALKCAMQLDISSINMNDVKVVASYIHGISNEQNDYSIFDKMTCDINVVQQCTEEQLIFVAKMCACHGKAVWHDWRNRNRYRYNLVQNLKISLDNIQKKYIKMSNDIDLFITTENPDIIIKSIRFLHQKLIDKFNVVGILRTEHSLTFFSKNANIFLPSKSY